MNRLPIVDAAGGSCGAGGSPLPAALPVDPATCRGTFAMVSLGCPKNLVDSERMLGLLRQDGWQLVGEPRGADLVVVDVSRPGALDVLDLVVAAGADVVAFGPHVETELLAAASAAGARVLPRSKFFADVGAAVGVA